MDGWVSGHFEAAVPISGSLDITDFVGDKKTVPGLTGQSGENKKGGKSEVDTGTEREEKKGRKRCLVLYTNRSQGSPGVAT